MRAGAASAILCCWSCGLACLLCWPRQQVSSPRHVSGLALIMQMIQRSPTASAMGWLLVNGHRMLITSLRFCSVGLRLPCYHACHMSWGAFAACRPRSLFLALTVLRKTAKEAGHVLRTQICFKAHKWRCLQCVWAQQGRCAPGGLQDIHEGGAALFEQPVTYKAASCSRITTC